MQWEDRIGRRIKLRDLHVLHAVVQSGSMTKAAGQLAISVPVVSKAIAELEHVIGVSLLDRSPQGVEPTAYGRALLHRGLAAFDELRQGIKDIEFLADPTAGHVRIGSTAPLAASFVSAVIDRLSRQYPRVTFEVLVANTEEMQRDLDERRVDVLIARRFGMLDDEALNFEPLYDNRYVVLAGARNPWVRRKTVKLAELIEEPWVMPSPDSAAGSFVTGAFRACGLDVPRVNVLAFAYEVRVSLLATGRYLTILPESVLLFPTPNRRIKVLPVDLALKRMPIGIITLKRRTLSPVAKLFIDCARGLARPLVSKR
jgi:DNA-binding transcriptional LysR family regulator